MRRGCLLEAAKNAISAEVVTACLGRDNAPPGHDSAPATPQPWDETDMYVSTTSPKENGVAEGLAARLPYDVCVGGCYVPPPPFDA